jgi:hypothetical protein
MAVLISAGGNRKSHQHLLNWRHDEHPVSAIAALSLSFLGMALYPAKGDEKVDTRVFELRTYTAKPGKIDELHARFRDHTLKLFEKHHMTLIGFWKPTDAEQAKQKLVYLLGFPSKEAGTKSWKDFQADLEWKAVKETSEKDGPLVETIDSVYLNPTDCSPLK